MARNSWLKQTPCERGRDRDREVGGERWGGQRDGKRKRKNEIGLIDGEVLGEDGGEKNQNQNI